MHTKKEIHHKLMLIKLKSLAEEAELDDDNTRFLIYSYTVFPTTPIANALSLYNYCNAELMGADYVNEIEFAEIVKYMIHDLELFGKYPIEVTFADINTL